MWETGGPFIFNGTYDTSFSLDLQVKDVHLMYEMAKEAEVIYKKISSYILGNLDFFYFFLISRSPPTS